MALSVDKNLCDGSAVCINVCSSVFALDSNGQAYVKEGANENEPCVDDAIAQCPMGAISR